ncbi:hypothetical protein L249_2739 [Ophiocordyceps polyrhachis-furcata BCC 54312]|uniref:Uncharacterized protein n=1 Tax=Ophiocordyceps polyrhachis-furcata BCC 54312 TaxID=1330021 RepID=A0A367LNZ1_9HYPO|nr:hypothetical protein L249_2739 [Ophiocordyceps polyrhachis-furcata BCC 54312]
MDSSSSAMSEGFTYQDVAEHNTKKDLYLVIHDKVYDCAEFVDEHPGGEEVMLDVAGQDATEAFEDVGHSDEARETLDKLLVGKLRRQSGDPVPQVVPQTSSTSGSSSDQNGLGMGLYVILLIGSALGYLAYYYHHGADDLPPVSLRPSASRSPTPWDVSPPFEIVSSTSRFAMSSYLEKQSSAFRGTLASAASKLSNAKAAAANANSSSMLKTATAASLAPPSPSPSAASDSATPSGKRKRETMPEVPFSQPQLTGYGSEVKTQMTFAVEYLKKKGDQKSMTDIIDHLSLQSQPEDHKRELAEGLRGHPRIEWRPDESLTEQTWRTGTYVHRPIIPGVRDGTSLLAFLQRKTDASGVAVKDLKDGWPDCEETLASLEKQNKVLVVRTKKDNFPRHVWPDDASLKHVVQAEFQARWHAVPLPSLEDMHRKLVSVGQKPTSEDPRKLAQALGSKPKTQKKKAGKKQPTEV